MLSVSENCLAASQDLLSHVDVDATIDRSSNMYIVHGDEDRWQNLSTD